MPIKVASNPVFMQKVLTNGTDFIGLYFRSEKNLDNSEVSDKFYWAKTDASGIFTNERNNALNGYFSSQGAAETDLPSGGYGDLSPTDEFQTRREWGIKIDFPFNSGYTQGGNNISLNQAIVDMKQFISAGATYVQNTLQWDDVFLSLSAQNANENSAWARYDDLFNWILSYDNKTKIAIRINVTKSGRTHNDMQGSYDPTNNLWPLSKAQKDTTGSVMRVYDDKGCFSFADTSAVSQALDFVTKVKNRYSTLFGSRLLWISVVTTSQDESGYNYENWWRDFPTPGYDASYRRELYDYSQLSIESFRSRMNTKYGSISAINAAWGTNFASVGVITPPYPASMENDFAVESVYSGTRGNDWYEHNYELLKAFHVNCKSIVNTVCKYTIENGSCSDLIRRLTIDVLDANNYSDMLKAQFHELPGYPDLGLSVDYMRANYTKKLGVELSQLDFAGIYPATGSMYNFITNGGVSAIRNGAMDILMIANSIVSGSDYTQVLNGFQFIKNYSESGFSKVVPARTVTFTIKQILDNPNFLIDTFRQQGGRESRIDMKINDVETPSDPTVYKSVFTFNQKTNGNPVPTSGNYVNGYLRFESFSHGIVAFIPDPVGGKIGMQCKLEYTIKNAANEIVINLKDNYGGFHPNYQPFAGDANTPPAESYYRVWTPSFYDYGNLQWVRDFYNNFTAISGTPFNVANDRGNNHFEQYSKYFPEGTYTITIKNTGLFPFELRAGKISVFDTQGLADVYETIPANNQEYTFTLNVQNNGVGEAYKINAFIR